MLKETFVTFVPSGFGKSVGVYYNFNVPSLKLTSKAPENQWLEDELPLGMAYFQRRAVRGCLEGHQF